MAKLIKKKKKKPEEVTLKGVMITHATFLACKANLELSSLLSQLKYWCYPDANGKTRLSGNNVFEGKEYLAKTNKEIADECHLTLFTLRRRKKEAENLGYIETRVTKRFKDTTMSHWHLTEKFCKVFQGCHKWTEENGAPPTNKSDAEVVLKLINERIRRMRKK